MCQFLRSKAYKALAIFLVAGQLAPQLARAADCAEQITKADASYHRGDFEEAITLLESCLGTPNLPQVEREQAYRLLGLTYLAKDYRNNAREAVRHLLELVPNYVADPDTDPPPFVMMVDEIRAELYPPKPQEGAPPVAEKHSHRWLYIGLGVVVAGAVTAVALGSGGDTSTNDGQALPLPPALPPTN